MGKKTKKAALVAKASASALVTHEPVQVNLADIQFAPYNPRVMSPARMAALKESLKKHGIVLNLVVQKQSAKHGPMVMIGGHQRVTAVHELCAETETAPPTKAWAVVLDVDDPTAMQLNISLNNVEGEFDPYKVGLVLAEIYPSMLPNEVVALGFEPEHVQEMIQLTLPPVEQEQSNIPEFAKSVTLALEFTTVALRDKAKALLQERVKGSKKKPGDLVLSMLRHATK
jgi:ParB-like chromosome segregation protein Spo0J